MPSNGFRLSASTQALKPQAACLKAAAPPARQVGDVARGSHTYNCGGPWRAALATYCRRCDRARGQGFGRTSWLMPPRAVAVPREEHTASAGGDLPLEYDEMALESWCSRRPREMSLRWANFLRVTVPFMARVGASFSMGNIERDEVVLARELCRALSDLGPTFVKLGQLMSSRSDLLSPGVAKELSRLQSKVPPFSDAAALQACPRCMLFAALAGLTRPPFAVADQTIREELGCPIGDVFSEISSVNVASASLAQVYKGRLHTGEVVAVKVQRPDALQIVAQDLVILKRGVDYYKSTIFTLARDLGPAGVNLSIRDLELLLETWASGFYAELDFSREGRMQTRFRDAIVGRIDHCYIPKVYTQYCTRQMLVSEWVSTTRITEGRAEEAQHLLGVSARCFAFQLLELGLFHGDPHAGNMLRLRGENGLPDRLCLLDFGLVAEIPVDARPGIARATVHAAEGRWSKYIDALIELEILDESLIDREQVEALTERILQPFVTGQGTAGEIVERMDTQQLMLDLAESADIPVRTPPYLPLLSRSLSILEGVALAVNPRYSMLRAVAPLASHWLQDKGLCEEEDVWGESTGRPGAADAAVDLLTSDSVATSVEMATLARWVLTADSISAQAALERILQQPELSSDTCCVPCGRERSAAAPLRLLRLAMVATSLDEDDSTSPAEHQGETSAGSRLGSWRPARRNSCLEVQKHVVSQAALAADLCSRCIIRGRADAGGDDSDGYGPKLVASLPDFLHSPSKQALDAVFPPLDAIETAQAKRLMDMVVNTVGVEGMDELRELLTPWAVMKCLRDGLPIQGLQQFADTFAGHPASGDLWPEIYARVRDTYVSRLKLKL